LNQKLLQSYVKTRT